MVTVEVPVAAVLLAVNVSVLVLVAGFGLNDAVTPVGRPDAARVTAPVYPLIGVTVMVLFPLPPCGIVAGDTDEAERLKSGVATALTLSMIVVG
jgi:hypothetical protein